MARQSGKKKDVWEKIFFILYLLVFFCMAATLALLQQHNYRVGIVGAPPDEAGRYLISKYICTHGTLPNGFDPEVRMAGYGVSYAFYTMLPYIVQGYLMRFVSLFTSSELMLLYTARFTNVICGTVMAAVVYAIGGRVFSDRRFKWLFCVLVMYLPETVFVHSYVNTDSMALLSTAIIVYGLVCAYRDGFTVRNSMILSVGIIICALSYYNAYGFILSSILLFIAYYFYKEKNTGKIKYDWGRMWKRGALIAGIVLLGIGWAFLRNAILYDGDILGLKSLQKCQELYGDFPIYANAYVHQGVSVFQMIKETDFFTAQFITFVGGWGSVSIQPNIWMCRFYKAVLYLGLFGFVLAGRDRTGDKLTKCKRIFFHINMAFCMLMPVLLSIYYSYTMDFQNQGRYVLPAVVPLMMYATRGLERLAKLKWVPKWLCGAAVCAAIAAAVGILFWMTFGYGVPVFLKEGVI